MAGQMCRSGGGVQRQGRFIVVGQVCGGRAGV